MFFVPPERSGKSSASDCRIFPGGLEVGKGVQVLCLRINGIFFFFFWCVLVLENMKCTVNVEIW